MDRGERERERRAEPITSRVCTSGGTRTIAHKSPVTRAWPSTIRGCKAAMDPCIADLLSPADNPVDFCPPLHHLSLSPRWRVNATGGPAAFIASIPLSLEFPSSLPHKSTVDYFRPSMLPVFPFLSLRLRCSVEPLTRSLAYYTRVSDIRPLFPYVARGVRWNRAAYAFAEIKSKKTFVRRRGSVGFLRGPR